MNENSMEEILRKKKIKRNPEPTLEDALMNNRPEQVPDEPTQDEMVTQALSQASAQERLMQMPPQGVLGKVGTQKEAAVKKIDMPKPKNTQMMPTPELGGKIAKRILSQPEAVQSLSPKFQKETPTTPILVSNTDPQPADKTSTPESQEQPPQGKSLDWKCPKCGVIITGKEEQIKRYPSMHECGVGITLGVEKDINLRRLRDFVGSPEYTVNWVRQHLCHISRIPNVIPSLTLWDGTNLDEVASCVYTTARTTGYVENNWPVLCMVMGQSRGNTVWAAGVLTTIALFDTVKLMPNGG